MLLNLTESGFFFLREAFCGLQYAENAFAAGANLSRTSLGELTTFPRPSSRLGMGHPPQTHLTRRLQRLQRPGLPPYIISGYPTDTPIVQFTSRVRFVQKAVGVLPIPFPFFPLHFTPFSSRLLFPTPRQKFSVTSVGVIFNQWGLNSHPDKSNAVYKPVTSHKIDQKLWCRIPHPECLECLGTRDTHSGAAVAKSNDITGMSAL